MSHSFVDNPTLRGMRQSIEQTFNQVSVFDLHGNSTRKERCPDGSEDNNVFDIKQGVAILVVAHNGRLPEFASVRYGEAWGTRETKYALLSKSTMLSTPLAIVTSVSPFYLFKPQDIDARKEFDKGFKITEIFIKGNVGIITARDNMVIDFETKPLVQRARTFRDSELGDEELCALLDISVKKGWDIPRAREFINKDKDLKQYVNPLCYRPFDTRLVFYHPSLVWGMSYPTMQHMLSGGNLAMTVGRAGQVIGQGEWDILFCTRNLSEFNPFRRGGHNLLPLYLVLETDSLQKDLAEHRDWQANLSPTFLKSLSKILGLCQTDRHDLPEGLSPEDIFYYAYAVFHSPEYRRRYAEFLKMDFPRLPLTNSLDLFRPLAKLGGELVAIHLMESNKSNDHITTFQVSGDNKVVKVGEKGKTLADIQDGKGKLYINKTQYFDGIPEDVWNFYIGGYQVCYKWLADRKKAGRKLSAGDIEHYHKIVVAINETIKIMNQIDEVIEAHGGWPIK